MNIGIDLDGVLFDTESMYRTFSEVYNTYHFKKKIIDKEELLAEFRYDWTKEELNTFIDNCLVYIQENAPAMYLAKEVLFELKKAGHKLFIVTSRGLLTQKEIEITNVRLKELNVEFDGIVFNAKDKFEHCKELNINLMIEDNLRNVQRLSENGIKCLYFRDLVVKHCDNKNVTEVRNWGEIYTELVNMKIIDAKDIVPIGKN